MSRWRVDAPSMAGGAEGPKALTAAEIRAITALGYPPLASEFDLGGPLGKGGNGVVRRGTRKGSGQEFAVKSVPKVLSKEEQAIRAPGGLPVTKEDLKKNVDNIKNEIDVLRKLSGSLNVVDFYGAYEDDTHVYLVMEVCTGGEILHDIGKGAIYNEEVVSVIVRDALRTVSQCHAHHILHRDIKPGNFMRESPKEGAPIKAIDFGLAAFFVPGKPRSDLGADGTPWYMSPETLRSQAGPAGDVWAVGVMTYQLLSGWFPFNDHSSPHSPVMSKVWKSVLNDELKMEGNTWATISEQAKAFVRRVLVKDPAQRPTAAEALQDPWVQPAATQEGAERKKKPLGGQVVQRLQHFSTHAALKRRALALIAEELDRASRDASAPRDLALLGKAANLNKLKRVFDTMAEAGGGLDPASLQRALRKLGYKLRRKEASHLVRRIDASGDDGGEAIGYSEFLAALVDWEAVQGHPLWEAWAEKAFALLDVDADGVLRPGDLATSLHGHAHKEEVATAHIDAVREAGAEEPSKSGGAGGGAAAGFVGGGVPSWMLKKPAVAAVPDQEGVTIGTFKKLLHVDTADVLTYPMRCYGSLDSLHYSEGSDLGSSHHDSSRGGSFWGSNMGSIHGGSFMGSLHGASFYGGAGGSTHGGGGSIGGSTHGPGGSVAAGTSAWELLKMRKGGSVHGALGFPRAASMQSSFRDDMVLSGGPEADPTGPGGLSRLFGGGGMGLGKRGPSVGSGLHTLPTIQQGVLASPMDWDQGHGKGGPSVGSGVHTLPTIQQGVLASPMDWDQGQAPPSTSEQEGGARQRGGNLFGAGGTPAVAQFVPKIIR